MNRLTLSLAAFLIPIITGGILTIGTCESFAADLHLPKPSVKASPLAPACPWCGLYIGADGGYGGADFIANFDDSRDLTSLSAKHSANGILGGAHIGYNYQFGMFVVGAETDVMMTGIKSTANGAETSLPWLGTTRIRAGFALNEYIMAYATGGIAYGHVKVGDLTGSNMVFTTPTVGWVAGGGLEYKITQQLGVRAEYLHVDLDGPSVTNGVQTLGTRVPVDIVRGGMSYYF